MIRTYIKTAFRNLARNKGYAIINISGLAVALATCIVIFLVIQYEFSYDRFYQNTERMFQVVTKDVDADGEQYTSGVPFPSIEYLRKDYPQVTFGELMQNYGTQVTATDATGVANEKKFIEETGLFYADAPLMDIFEMKWLSGNAAILNDVNNGAMSKSVAEKYFGDWKQATGKYIKLNNSDYIIQVAGVFEDMPANSDFPFSIVISYKAFLAHEGKQWGAEDWGANSSNHQVYALLPENSNIVAMNSYLNGFEKKYNTDIRDTKRTHFLQPVTEVHFDERFSNNGDHISSKTSLYTLAFVGMLIILMACINFINLSTALAVTRSKEVGVRKVMGSSKAQLRWQVIIETAVIVLMALALAVIIAWICLPYIRYVVVVQQPLALLSTESIVFIAAITIVTIILSALYPSAILSRFRPIEALKNKINTTRVGSISLRRLLVVLQFAFSQILVIATIIAISQMNFIRNADLGFNKEAILLVYGNSDSASIARQQAFKNELLARSDIKSVSFCYDAPSSDNSWSSNFAFDKMEDRDYALRVKFGDHDYLKTYGLQLVAGRFYEASDTARVYVVNETFVKKAGLSNPQDALGKMLRVGGNTPREVIGVIKDFKAQSLREEIPPLAIFPNKKYSGTVGIKLSSTNLARSNDAIKEIWDKYYPEYVYNSSFLEDDINNFYLQESRLSMMYKVCALLAILISCLGLYGLVSFMVVQKTKEVGIRKVLGASAGSIVYLFSKEFTLLIIIAFALAAPAAWYLMQEWLTGFVYRIDMGPGVFILAIMVSIAIAWATVGYKSVKAAMANPVKSLRSE